MNKQMREIVNFLREALPDIPVHVTDEGGPYADGINVWRFSRRDYPSRSFPSKGTMVRVMYSPEQESEELWPERVRRVQEAMLPVYGDRWVPSALDPERVLIQDPDTAYAAHRRAEYVKRAELGYRPLHELGK